MRKIILFLTVAALIVTSLASCGGSKTDESDSADVGEWESVAQTDTGAETQAGTEENTAGADGTVTVPTKYCDLKVPASFEGEVTNETVSEDPLTVRFSAKDGTLIFDIVFDGEAEMLLGTLPLEDKNVIVNASFGALDESSENFNKYAEFQEDINTVIENLVADYGFIAGQEIAYEDATTFDIETRVTTFKYPNKWKDKIIINVTDDEVTFTCKNERLFDLSFVEPAGGFLLGTYGETPIYITDYLVEEQYYTEDEVDEMYAMQEDVNVILQHLMEDPAFKVNLK